MLDIATCRIETRYPLPEIVDADEWQRQRDELLVREKAHTRAGDAISAARRRLPATPVPPTTLIGADGPTSLVDVFEGRPLLVAYAFMWHRGKPTAQPVRGLHADDRRPVGDGCRPISPTAT